MIALILMGGKGTRFSEEGYKINKASIPTYDRHTGTQLPMVVCAMKDIPQIHNDDTKIICVSRDFHLENGTEAVIKEHFKNVTFIHDHVLLDQAFGCLLAREFLLKDDELFLGCCDCGFNFHENDWNNAKKNSDAIMISHTNDNNIKQNPNAHSWAVLKPQTNLLSGISIKKPVSDQPMNDHATTGMFWFKSSKKFLELLEEMIFRNDRFDNKFYVDKLLQYYINKDLKVRHHDVDFFCWGTPYDYETYQRSFTYWSKFISNENK